MSIQAVLLIVSALLIVGSAGMAAQDEGLIGHWKLVGDCRDSSGHGSHGVNHGASLGGDGAAFNGTDGWIEVLAAPSLRLGARPFSIAVWVHTEAELDDGLGDILSHYDPATRTGVNLCLMNYAGVTSAQSNHRNLFFGIDAGRIDGKWTDCGRPGNAVLVSALAVHDGKLYAATCEPGEGQTGHVYRCDGGTTWTDCGAPDRCNTIGALAVHDGKLYAGSMHYGLGGSALPESPNREPGGRVFRYEGGPRWTDCGKLGDVPAVGGLLVFKGKLYASGHYQRPTHEPCKMGLYRYEGGTAWAFCGDPGHRTPHLAVHNGDIYATSYNGSQFARYDGGTKWTAAGPIPDTTQSYSVAVHQGRMHVGTWPNGSVFRHDGGTQWTLCGRLGEEKEVMGMAVYNGKLYAGTLPLAQVYRYDGGTTWTCTGQLDATPDVKYRRAWSMAVYQGKLFAGTLPSGRVLSLEAGKCVTHDRALEPGWRHIAAVRAAGRLELYVDGQRVATSSAFGPGDYNLAPNAPLRLGFGEHDYLNGKLRDLRLYARALKADEIRALCTQQ